MTNQRYTIHVGVYLFLTRKTSDHIELLLQKRANTGYMDGKFDASCSGHLEPNESLATCIIREAKEELDITIDERHLKQIFLGQVPGENYLKVFFTINSDYIKGTPHINEPDFCSDLRWFPINNLSNLPVNIAPFTRNVLNYLQHDIHYGTI